jgi:hypothetical protein
MIAFPSGRFESEKLPSGSTGARSHFAVSVENDSTVARIIGAAVEAQNDAERWHLTARGSRRIDDVAARPASRRTSPARRRRALPAQRRRRFTRKGNATWICN